MTSSFIPPADDAGIRHGRSPGRIAGSVTPVQPVRPYPAPDSAVAGRNGDDAARQASGPPAGEERRRGERRQRRTAVLLDTRGKIDRRARPFGGRA